MVVDTGKKRVVGWVFIAVVLSFAAQGLMAAPQAELWPRWEANNPGSTRTVDHRAWEAFLSRYLVTNNPDGVNRMRYAQVDATDRARLQQYIRTLESVPVSDLSRAEQLPYWTNLYNALTVELILTHFPVRSIRDIRISGPLYNRHPWDAPLARVEGEALTLNDIEHRIMRPIWRDPRIHYVVNCASIGCPNLLPVAFTAQNWDSLADEAARAYINNPRGADFSAARPALSSIFDWYAVDFGGDIASVVAHIRRYADGPVAAGAERFAAAGHRARVTYQYDWSLNTP